MKEGRDIPELDDVDHKHEDGVARIESLSVGEELLVVMRDDKLLKVVVERTPMQKGDDFYLAAFCGLVLGLVMGALLWFLSTGALD